MNVQLNVTRDLFDSCVDMEYARVQFAAPRNLAEAIEVDIWGLLLRNAGRLFGESLSGELQVPDGKTVFIEGWSRLTFQDVTKLDLHVALYRGNTNSFHLDEQGNKVCLEHHVLREEAAGYEYCLGGVLLWPFGDCGLDVLAVGPVILEFDNSDCVSCDDFEKRFESMELPESCR